MSLNLDPEKKTFIPEAEKPAAKNPICKINWWFLCCCKDIANCFICFNWCRGGTTVILPS